MLLQRNQNSDKIIYNDERSKMEKYNDFATIGEDKIAQASQAYQSSLKQNTVEILRGDGSNNQSGDRYIGTPSPIETPTTSPIETPVTTPINQPSQTTPNNNNSSTPTSKAKNNSLAQFNLLLLLLMLELIYGSSTGCRG